MKKMVIVTGLFLTLALGHQFIWPHIFNKSCETNKLSLSNLEIGTEDQDYLKIRMGFSYGSQLDHFLPRLKSASANTYYKKKKSKPWLTYLSSNYKTKRSAKKAFRHLKRKWKNNKKNQYDVMLHGRTVTWFGNNRFTPQCFYQVVASEKEKLKINEVASSNTTPQKRKKRVISKKKRSKKSRTKSAKKRKSKKSRKRKALSAKKRKSKKRRIVAAKKKRRKK